MQQKIIKYLGQDEHAVSGFSFYEGDLAPSNALGNDGDLYYRRNGNTSDALFKKVSGAWYNISLSGSTNNIDITGTEFTVFTVSGFGTQKSQKLQKTVLTTDNIPTTLHTYILPITDGKVFTTFECYVTQTGGVAGTVNDGGVFKRTCAITYNSGTPTIHVVAEDYTYRDAACPFINIDWSIVGPNVELTVTGETNKDFRWSSDITINYMD